MKGKIKDLKADKGFGFIAGEDGHIYFFHMSALKNCVIVDLEPGMYVNFEETDSQKGPRAEDIYVD